MGSWKEEQEDAPGPAGAAASAYLMVPVGDGSGLMRWAMLSGMLMVRGEICGCTAFTGDSGASRFTFLPLDRAVKVILMLVLGNLKVHLEGERMASFSQRRSNPNPGLTLTQELEEEPAGREGRSRPAPVR